MRRLVQVSNPNPQPPWPVFCIPPKKLNDALSNWNGISGMITAVLSPPFILTLYPLSLDFALTVVKAPE